MHRNKNTNIFIHVGDEMIIVLDQRRVAMTIRQVIEQATDGHLDKMNAC